MRSLEIRTDRIFNNLIEQNQKLAADFVLKQSKIVSSAQSPTSSVKSPAHGVEYPVSRVQYPESDVEGSVSSIQSPASRVQHPESSVQSPKSNSCIQSPGIPVCLLIFSPKVVKIACFKCKLICDKGIFQIIFLIMRFASYFLFIRAFFFLEKLNVEYHHCVKNVHILSCSGPHFPAFGLNSSEYGHFLRSA